MSQYQLGVLAGLEESSSSARMSRYESGIHEPPLQFAQTLATILGISPAYFYCPDDQLAEMILIYSLAPTAKRVEIYKIVNIFDDRKTVG